MKKLLILFLFINFFLLNPTITYASDYNNPAFIHTPDVKVVPIGTDCLQLISNPIPEELKQISKHKINIIDPCTKNNASGAFFPGARGSNQLIIYTPKYGKYTGTNEYGKEATVINGRVVSFNGANSFIPPNGYIISGHGEAAKWINQNLIEGANIELQPKRKIIKCIVTPESYLFKTYHRINEARNAMIYYKRTLPGYECPTAEKNYNASLEKFEKAKYLIGKENCPKAIKYLKSSLLLAEEAFHLSIPAARNELHGVWVRPVEQNRSEIAKTLKRLKKTGIKDVFLETFYQGYTIYPSPLMEKYALTPQRAEFAGWDPLQCWIEEAHKRNMKVHIWFQAYYVGNEDVSVTKGHILNVYPEWANVQRKNAHKKSPQPSKSEHNGYFLDPSNHLVKEFLLSLINEISTLYAIDGLNIDYVRYPKSLTTNFPSYLSSTWGYTDYAKNDFQNQYGKDPLKISMGDPLWNQWTKYRQDKVTELVTALKPTINNEDVVISAVIFPDADNTSTTKLQKWQDWAKNESIDAYTPLIMSSDELRASTAVNEIRKLVGDSVHIYPGLFEPFTAGTSSDLINQIISIRKAGASGVVLFDNAHLSDDYTKALKARIFRN